MQRTIRKFTPHPAARAKVPLWVGLVGPSSSGKTKSALRIADGILSVTGGKHFLIDTESDRALHHADKHAFTHVPFTAPFGSLDYLDAVRQCVADGASVITVDSMSHEHENVGGMLDMQEQELHRMAGDDYAKRENCKFAAWIKPKRNRTLLLQGLLTLKCNLIFCFRAREKTKPLKVEGKMNFVQMGFQPIAGEEFLFEQTVNCLLLPQAGGVPTWQSEEPGERATIKLPDFLQSCFEKGKPLDEPTGKNLALWAKGDDVAARGEPANAHAANGGPPADAQAGHPAPTYDADDLFAQVLDELTSAARHSMKELERVWISAHPRYQNRFKDKLPELKETARKADEARKAAS